jgi:hypothetical protein
MMFVTIQKTKKNEGNFSKYFGEARTEPQFVHWILESTKGNQRKVGCLKLKVYNKYVQLVMY